MRNLTKTLAAVTLMTPMGAHPLGVGDIELHSSLNQTLNAEIALNLSEDESLGVIRVKLAPAEKFAEIGIPRSYFLSQMKFDTVVKPDGTVVIELSSDGVLKEPFLDFLLEVSWPKGSIYREFSVLVDPPATFKQTAAPVINQGYQQARPQTTKPYRASSSSAQNMQGIEQYTIAKNDTLWKIASRVKPAGVSVEQMMIALFEANPHAFYKNNINNVMLGKTLQVPAKSAVLKLSQAAAQAEFSRQTKVWKGQVSAPSVATKKPSYETAQQESSQLKLVAPEKVELSEEDIIDVQPADNKAYLDEQAGSGTAPKTADKELNERLGKLEQQLMLMQEMLALRNEQIAELQNQNKLPPETAETEIKPQPPVEEVKPESAPTLEQQKPIEPAKPAPIAKPVKPVQPKVDKIKPRVQPKAVVIETKSSDDTLYYTIFGVAGFTVLGLFGWWVWRKKMFDEDDSTESMFAASSEIILPEEDQELSIPMVDDDSNYDVGTVGESSFLSEFVPSDFDAFDTEQAEVDPISEADVYLAYGRYQQAEELMRHAIEDHPDRDECKLKLLEIFYANEDKKSFVAYSQELVDAGKKEEVVFWTKVAEMGSEVAPEEAMFTGQENNSAEVNVDTHVAIESVDVDQAGASFDISEFDSDMEASEQATDTDDISGTIESIDQMEDTLDDVADMDEKAAATDDIESVDFDMDNLVADDNESTDTGIEDIQAIETLDFDLNSPEQTTAATDSENSAFGDTFDFSEDALNEVSSDTGSDTGSDENDIDFSFDLDKVDEQPGQAEDEELLYDLNKMDEMDTKIDLAKAYIDMGDPDAAKSIMEEVLAKGSNEQKKQAQLVLDSML